MTPFNRAWQSLFVVALSLALTGRAEAQVRRVPDDALRLIVAIRATYQDVDKIGAGIVLGETAENIVIVTARHVVEDGYQDPEQTVVVRFAFARESPVPARVMQSSDLDLVALLVSKNAVPGYRQALFSWNRQGNVRSLRGGDEVTPIGCPNGVCWKGQSPDPLIGVRTSHLYVESDLISQGGSGGGLFNADWEVVGMMLNMESIQGEALSIDRVVAQVRQWGYPVALHRPGIPRRGYRLTLGASIISPMGGEKSPFPDDRFTSGRLVLSTQRSRGLAYHLSGLRLAPDQLNVNALMSGVSLTLRYGRLSLLPFAEVGFGRVEGRFDAGGYFVANPNAPGGNQYVPFWRQEKQDGLGFGGGVALQAILLPHVMLEGTLAHWNFSLPDNVRELQDFFLGAGVRWGL